MGAQHNAYGRWACADAAAARRLRLLVAANMKYVVYRQRRVSFCYLFGFAGFGGALNRCPSSCCLHLPDNLLFLRAIQWRDWLYHCEDAPRHCRVSCALIAAPSASALHIFNMSRHQHVCAACAASVVPATCARAGTFRRGPVFGFILRCMVRAVYRWRMALRDASALAARTCVGRRVTSPAASRAWLHAAGRCMFASPSAASHLRFPLSPWR